MSCLLSYYNTVPFPLQSNLRAVFCTFYIPHLFQLLKNPGCSCAVFRFSIPKCKISTLDCAGFDFSLLKCTISTPDCAGFDFFLLKCKIRSQNYVKQRISLDISSRQSAALSAAIFLRNTRLILAKCFCFTKEACSLKQKEKRRSLSYTKTYSAVFSLDYSIFSLIYSYTSKIKSP